MTILAYIAVCLAFINVVAGMMLIWSEDISLDTRRWCYINVLVQLPIVCAVLVFGGNTPHFIKFIMTAVFFLGYYLTARASWRHKIE